jgi:flagellar P-ring protein precursor FlgI
MSTRHLIGALLAALAALLLPRTAAGQDARVRDLTLAGGDVPVRLVGYGLVVGLDGTGDRAIGGYGARHTVQSIANLLRNFDIEVPVTVLRTRNVAAVLVTAEVSPYLRPGGRFDVHVASLGDAVSLRGGVLWMTPLVPDVGGQPVATAQGPLVLSDGAAQRAAPGVETSARIPDGGLLEVDLPRPAFGGTSRLVLRDPDLGTALRIAAAIDAEFGDGTAVVEDPGAIALRVPADANMAAFLARVGELRIAPDRRPQIIIDARDGTVVAGGDLRVGEAVVSHGGMTLAIGGPGIADVDGGGMGAGGVRLGAGASVQEVAAALHAVGAAPQEIAAIFESLRRIGALSAEVVSR